MGYVVSLYDFRPGDRYDEAPWTEARIEEAAAKAGPFEQIDVQALTPVDTDPTSPLSRNFTTGEATLPSGWYRVIFADAAGGLQQSDAVYFPGTGIAASLSLEELKEHLDAELIGDDDLLERYLAAAFLQAQAPAPYGCGRLLTPDPAPGADPVVRTSRLRGSRRRVVVRDAREITAVTVDDAAAAWEVALERDDHIVLIDLPDLAAPVGTADGRLARRVCEVTGRFGFEAIPDNLRNAIYVLAARAVHERDAAYADQVAIAEGAGVQSYYRQLPPATKLVFATYSLPSGLGGLS